MLLGVECALLLRLYQCATFTVRENCSCLVITPMWATICCSSMITVYDGKGAHVYRGMLLLIASNLSVSSIPGSLPCLSPIRAF